MRTTLIDSKVIDGHIIPYKTLFTSAVKPDEPYPSMAFEDNLKVQISFFTQTEGKTVKSELFGILIPIYLNFFSNLSFYLYFVRKALLYLIYIFEMIKNRH